MQDRFGHLKKIVSGHHRTEKPIVALTVALQTVATCWMDFVTLRMLVFFASGRGRGKCFPSSYALCSVCILGGISCVAFSSSFLPRFDGSFSCNKPFCFLDEANPTFPIISMPIHQCRSSAGTGCPKLGWSLPFCAKEERSTIENGFVRVEDFLLNESREATHKRSLKGLWVMEYGIGTM